MAMVTAVYVPEQKREGKVVQCIGRSEQWWCSVLQMKNLLKLEFFKLEKNVCEVQIRSTITAVPGQSLWQS